MIYLIQVRYEKITLLKIGYTGDNKKEARYTSYKLHNPLMEVLYEIPKGDEEDEKYLHAYFSEFKYSDYGNEWFTYDDSILDYFSTHKSKDSLQDLRNKGLVLDIKSLTRFKKLVESVINRVLNLKIDSGDITLEQSLNQAESMTDNILYNHRIRSEDRLWSFIENTFGYNKTDIFPDLEDKVTNFLKEFYALTRFTNKMRFLCDEREKFSEEEFNSLLESIDIVFKNYYLTIGPEKIRNLQYKNSVILEEYRKLKGNQDCINELKNHLYQAFIINNRYTKVFVKEKLGEIYNNLGIQSSPKATDIENYFEVKKVQITNKETGKKDHGYLILKIKE